MQKGHKYIYIYIYDTLVLMKLWQHSGNLLSLSLSQKKNTKQNNSPSRYQEAFRGSLGGICPDTISLCGQPCPGCVPIHLVSHSSRGWLTNPGKNLLTGSPADRKRQMDSLYLNQHVWHWALQGEESCKLGSKHCAWWVSFFFGLDMFKNKLSF